MDAFTEWQELPSRLGTYYGNLEAWHQAIAWERNRVRSSEIPVVKREAYDGDYLNETTHENGNYSHVCPKCKAIFSGYKHRVICKWCADRTPKREAQEPEIRVDEQEVRYAINNAVEATRHLSFHEQRVDVIFKALEPYLSPKQQAQPSEISETVAVPRKEYLMLKSKALSTLGNNLCPDHRDKQHGKPCLACTIEGLESLQKRESGNLAPMALRRLVNLKRHKDKHGKTDFYQSEQPEAWRMAEEALNSIEVEAP